MLLSTFKEFFGRNYIQTLLESGAAIVGMVKPMVMFKPVLGAGAFFSVMLSIVGVVTALLLVTSISLASAQYRNGKLRKRLEKRNAKS